MANQVLLTLNKEGVKKMKKRLAKKIAARDTEKTKKEIELILSKHWQLHLTEEDAGNQIMLKLLGFENLDDIPTGIKNRTNPKLRLAIEDVLSRNRETNQRHMTRIKLFPIKELIEDLFTGYDNWQAWVKIQEEKEENPVKTKATANA